MARDVEDSNRRLLRARDAIDRGYRRPLAVGELASIACLSEASFIRTFKATFGETPHRYLQRRRIERAMYLLRTTERSVTDVCMEVGFSSLGTFSRTFREIVGEPPSDFRDRGPVGDVPSYFVSRWTRPSRFRRSTLTPGIRTLPPMYNAISRSQIYVLDQDAALDFYVDTLGMEVATDADLGFMRWLTVRVPGDPVHEVLLERPGPPAMDEGTAAQVRELLTKGSAGGALFLTTDDAHATFAVLRERGVEVTDEPAERPYGIDFGIRDPFGNAIRIGQMFEAPGA